MQFIAFFSVELLLLFLLSRFVTGGLSGFIYRTTRSHKLAIYTLSFLFLPGTIIHELSHYITANLLFVRTGEIEFVPKVYEDRVKLGSVQIEKTDPVRRAIIGVAPFLVGTSLLLLILFVAERYQAFGSMWLSILVVYLIFEIGNTMFSSKKDMEGVLELFGVFLILFIILFLAGVRVPSSFFDYLSSPYIVSIFQRGSYFLLLPLSIDILFILVTNVMLKVLRR